MNFLESIAQEAFIDELSKLATLEKDEDGNIVYKSKDVNKDPIKQDPKSPNELYSEDSCGSMPQAMTEESRN